MNKFTGTLYTFFVGVNDDKIEVVSMDDDGTRALHIVFFYKNIPLATLPVINTDGLRELIKALEATYEMRIKENEQSSSNLR